MACASVTEDYKIRVEFHKRAATDLRAAYLALAEGGVQAYTIGSRSLTKFDLTKIREEIEYHEKKADELTSLLNGGKRRKAIGVVPRDW